MLSFPLKQIYSPRILNLSCELCRVNLRSLPLICLVSKIKHYALFCLGPLYMRHMWAMGTHPSKGSACINQERRNMIYKGELYQKHRSTKPLVNSFLLLVGYHCIRGKWKLTNANYCFGINTISAIIISIYLLYCTTAISVLHEPGVHKGKRRHKVMQLLRLQALSEQRHNFSDFIHFKTFHKQT